MSTVIRTELDDTQVAAGFKRIQAGANATTLTWNKMAAQTHQAGKVSAEGLGFVSQALGRINPSLALLGEQSTKQLPTIMALGTSMSKYVFAGGALAAIGASAGKVAMEMGRVRKETVDATSALGQLIETGKDINPNSFWGRLMNGTLAAATNLFGTSVAEIEEQQRDMARGAAWRDKGDEAKNRSEGIANSLRGAQSQRAKIRDYTSGIDGMDSASKIQALIAAEEKRIAGLVTLGKLTDEEAQASDAYTQALEQQYDVVIHRIDELRDLKADFAIEEKNRQLEDIKYSKDAKKNVDDLIGQYHQLYNTDQLTGEKKKALLAEINAAEQKYIELRNKEYEQNKLLLEQEKEARIERMMDMEREKNAVAGERAANLFQRLKEAGAGGGVGGGVIAQQGGGVQGWRQWGGAAAMGLNPFGPMDGNAGGEGGGNAVGGGEAAVGGGNINPRMRRQARNAAQKAFREEVKRIQQAFAEEMGAVDEKEKLGVDVADQRRDVRQRRKQRLVDAEAERANNAQENLVEAQKLQLDKAVEAEGNRRKLTREQIDLMHQLVDLQAQTIAAAEADRKDLDAIRAALGRAANNQRANNR